MLRWPFGTRTRSGSLAQYGENLEEDDTADDAIGKTSNGRAIADLRGPTQQQSEPDSSTNVGSGVVDWIQMENDFSDQLAKIEEEIRNYLAQMKAGYRNKLAQVKAGHRNQLAQIKAGHRNQLAQIKTGYRNQLAEKTETIRKLTISKRAKRRENECLKSSLDMLKKHSSSIAQEKEKLKKSLDMEQARCAGLTTDIARISHLKPEASKDDRYFESLFNNAFLSVHEWVLDYYLDMSVTISEEALQSFSPWTTDKFRLVAGKVWIKRLAEQHLFVIQAFIMEEVRQRLLNPFLCNFDESINYDKLMDHFSGNAEEIRNWRVCTVRLMVAHKDFNEKLRGQIEKMAHEILGGLTPLAPRAKPGPRLKRLKGILESLANCAIECQKEPSDFQFLTYEPSDDQTCQPTYMSDAEGAMDPQELKQRGASVILTVSPAVTRVSHGQSLPVIILPAKVWFDKDRVKDRDHPRQLIN